MEQKPPSAENIWLSISLADYEAHMSLPEVGQAQALARELGRLLLEFKPASVALVGCAGGNGLGEVDPAVTSRVVALDINPSFVAAADKRHGRRFATFEPVVCDVASDGEVPFKPVSLVFAGLLLEYVQPEKLLRFALESLERGGILACVVQLPCESLPEVTPSPFSSLEVLAPHISLVSPEAVVGRAEALGFSHISSRLNTMPNGKELLTLVFRK